MERLIVAVLIVAIAALVAIVARRRRPTDAPTQGNYEAPTQLDRSDFPYSDRPWLLVAFTSASCHTCADSVAKARVAESSSVGFSEIEYSAHRDLHQRYAIDAVPTLVLADHEGVVHASFLGKVTATDLWMAIAEAREPGSRPTGGCESHQH
jgi:hypothetical protein